MNGDTVITPLEEGSSEDHVNLSEEGNNGFELIEEAPLHPKLFETMYPLLKGESSKLGARKKQNRSMLARAVTLGVQSKLVTPPSLNSIC